MRPALSSPCLFLSGLALVPDFDTLPDAVRGGCLGMFEEISANGVGLLRLAFGFRSGT
jgi:hypothetical protein